MSCGGKAPPGRLPAAPRYRRWVRLTTSVALLGGPLVSCSATSSPASTVPPSPIRSPAYLTVAGRAFSFRGQTVYLRGVNINNEAALYLDQPSYQDADYSPQAGFAHAAAALPSKITEDERDFARLGGWGVNCIRFGLDWHWFGGNAATRATAYALMDRVVGWASKYHIWLIPTMFIPPGGGQDFRSGTRLWGSSTQFSAADMTPYMKQLRDFWLDFAGRYADVPAIAGYDLLNEPSTPRVATVWLPYAGYLRDQIRKVDRNHFFVVESGIDGQFPDRLPVGNPVKDTDIVYSVHDYTPATLTEARMPTYTYPGTAPGDDGTIRWWSKDDLDNLLRIGGVVPVTWAARENVPLYIGEFGSRKQTIGYVRYIADRIELMNTTWGVHWSLFVYREFDPSFDFGLYNGWNAASDKADGYMSSDPTVVPDTALIKVLKVGVSRNVMATP